MRFTWILAAALVFSACGGDDDGTTQSDGGPDANVQPMADGGPDATVGDANTSDPDGGLADASPPDAGPLARENCSNGVDDDGDTMADCLDSDCTRMLECLVDFTCPADQQKVYVRSADLPLFIEPLGTTLSNVNVGATGQVTRAAVQLSIRHDFVADLDVFLVPPSGAPLLMADNEGSGADYQHTILSDDGLQALFDADPPYRGVFRPDHPFSSLEGTGATGTWSLKVQETQDDSIIGALSEFGLALCVCENCELGLACENGTDDDGDNLADCADPDCMGNDSCALTALCAPGEVLVQVSPVNLPLAIPDSSSAQTTMPVTQAGTVKSVGVRFSITHTFDADLAMDLAAPGMTSVTLFSGVGSSNNDFTNTILVDSGSTLISDGTAPFTGVFRPTNPFSGFTGVAAMGNWTVTIRDQAGADVGTLDDFDLFVCVQP